MSFARVFVPLLGLTLFARVFVSLRGLVSLLSSCVVARLFADFPFQYTETLLSLNCVSFVEVSSKVTFR